MANLSSGDRSLVFAEIEQQPYATKFGAEEIERALGSAVEIFSPFEQKFVRGFRHVLLRSGTVQRPTGFAQELIPALIYAHRFFGDSLPKGLESKLSNQAQTHDTLLELTVLGAFQPHHNVQYEPTLADGKVPDLMLSPSAGPAVYIECKSQRLLASEHDRLFGKTTDRIHRILDLQSSVFVKKAWLEGLRTEVRLSQTPSEADLREFEQTLNKHTPTAESAPMAFGSAITLSLVPRDQAFDETKPPSVRLGGTNRTIVHHNKAHDAVSAVYPWPGLEIIRRRSQRRLLRSARLKLRSIPEMAYGLVCMQTVGSKRFVPDIHRLLRQKEFQRIPIVWLNPIGSRRLICRDDALLLRDQIFDALRSEKRDLNGVRPHF